MKNLPDLKKFAVGAWRAFPIWSVDAIGFLGLHRDLHLPKQSNLHLRATELKLHLHVYSQRSSCRPSTMMQRPSIAWSSLWSGRTCVSSTFLAFPASLSSFSLQTWGYDRLALLLLWSRSGLGTSSPVFRVNQAHQRTVVFSRIPAGSIDGRREAEMGEKRHSEIWRKRGGWDLYLLS